MRCTFTLFTVISSISLHYNLTLTNTAWWSHVKHSLLMSCPKQSLFTINSFMWWTGRQNLWLKCQHFLIIIYSLYVSKAPDQSTRSKHLAVATQGLISLVLPDKATQYVPCMFTGATLTSLWPPAPQFHCSCPGARCHTCRPPAASEWCSGSSSTDSPASPSPRSLDSPTDSHCKHSNIPPQT